MDIRFYNESELTEAVKIFSELSFYYLRENHSSASDISKNLVNNILGPDSGVKLVLAFDGDNAIGLATISLLYPAPRESAQLFIKELFVSRRYQNLGVGKKIMGFIARYAKSKNCCRLDFTVDSDNLNAVQFYQKLGIQKLHTKYYFRAEIKTMEKLAQYQ